MIRPILFLLILFFPFLVIDLHKINQQRENKNPKEKWNYIYIIFIFFYVLFIFYTAEVYNASI